MSLMSISGWLIFAAAVLAAVPPLAALRRKRLVRYLPQQSTATNAADEQQTPLVTVIIPARNEAERIADCFRTLLQTTGVTFEIIGVNDRSEDATGQLMDAAAQSDPRIRVIHIRECPSDWLGKNHAMHRASQEARGSLLLFTDGDILYQPGTIAAAVNYFRQNRLHHMCLLPEMICGSLLESVMTTFFGMSFAIGTQLHLIRTRFPLAYAGVGAFNLVDAQFYRSVGGHVPIRLDVLDDVKLGKLIKFRGGRSDFLLADGLLSVRWQPSLWGVVTGLEKNAFASVNYSMRGMLFLTLLFSVFFVAPVVVPILSLSGLVSFRDGIGFAATALLWHVLFAWLAWGQPRFLLQIPLFFAGPFLMAFAWWRSAVITLRQGGVRWRNSFYPLQMLRDAVFRG
jgi:glycosyltransferase involved in cell wall biosynthesis